jgi:major vault protein
MSRSQVIRLKPLQYCHIQDSNQNVTFVEVGPKTFTVLDHHTVALPPTPMIIVPPRHYCIIANPVVRSKEGEIAKDKDGQYKLRHGDEEVRGEGEPFPLYPGESLVGKVSPLQVVAPNTALKLRALRDCKDETGTARQAGDEWLFKGPGTYVPRVEQQIVEIVRATMIGPNQALRLRAKKEFEEKKTGEEWLVRTQGAYMPSVHEEIVGTIPAVVLTDKKALQLRAQRTFQDHYGHQRKAGEEWLVTKALAESHIPDVYETVVGEVPITTLTSRQYCVVLDPADPKTGKPALGMRELRKGERSFFLLPGERLEAGTQNVHVLDSSEALLLRAREQFTDGKETRAPGDRWMIYGPCDYVPPVSVEIVEKRRAIPLDKNEGVYVRDVKTGRVRAVTGSVYMLNPYEELWEKDLPQIVEDLLNREADSEEKGAPAKARSARDKTRVVTYRIPHNSAVQIYDYKAKKPRVRFGPELILLDPDEQFTVLSLSGNTPKQPKALNVIALLLGPRFSTDVVVVETADHARLSLKLSYNWHFEVDRTKEDQAAALFSVPDFIGDVCKAIASRVRGSVAQQTFDNFHKHSADLIRQSVFGLEADGKPKNQLYFSANRLVVTNIDIQSVEPVDSRTRDALQKSVQLAIEITTKSQEAGARHEAERREQEARGRLERQKIEDEAEAEKSRKELLQLQAQSAAVESTGQATAEAKARSEAAKIEGEAAVKQAELKAEAQTIKSAGSLALLKQEQEAEIAQQRTRNDIEITRAKALAEIESDKFSSIVQAIGAATLKRMAQAGPETEQRLLKGLGVKQLLVTDGQTPLNLFNGAQPGPSLAALTQ